MWNFFKKKETVVSEKPKMPQVKDYSPHEYSAYWEVYNSGQRAEIRFMDRKGKLLDSIQVTAHDPEEVKKKVGAVIVQKMSRYKKENV